MRRQATAHRIRDLGGEAGHEGEGAAVDRAHVVAAQATVVELGDRMDSRGLRIEEHCLRANIVTQVGGNE
jgi:hypothetical protein